MTGSFVGRGNRYIQLVKILYSKLMIISKQLPPFSHKVWGLNGRPERWEESVLPLAHCSPLFLCQEVGFVLICLPFCSSVFLITQKINEQILPKFFKA